MKYLIIVVIFVITGLSYSQCGTWDAKIVNIQWTDSCFVITGQNVMPDCETSSGIYFEWYARYLDAENFKIGNVINFDTYKPEYGYWLYKDMYVERKR